ncbi:hypothetical protein RUM44_005079 [Polyplax serrata]|uniref:V-type proton ATPase subunit a n=1 Tax=Polyplax serrata TaxID=468196 RepID=A0ABR1AE00_POLSC
MGSMFRTEEVVLCQLFIQPEAAYASVSILGELGIVQFRDLNANVNAFQRKFVAEVRRCDEMERKLRYFEVEVNKDRVRMPESEEIPKAPNPREITDLESKLEKTENEMRELSKNAVNLHNNYLELTELKHVLEKTQVFFTEPVLQQDEASESLTKYLINEDNAMSQAQRGRLGFVSGVVPRERVPAFEKMLWRISRGNVFLRQTEIENPLQDPNTRNRIYKTVFVAFFQGEELKSRVLKVCSGFHANVYLCPNSNSERQEMLEEVKTRLEDLNLILNRTQDHRERVLFSVARELHNWTVQVRKMKAIYHTLNMFNRDVTKKCLIGECWIPAADLQKVHTALADGSRAGGSSIQSFLNVIESLEDPPTFNRTNKYTKGFQSIIDAYGVSTYGEINPALYTIVTFPFLFAVMFGDSGHGLILTLFSGFMIYKEKIYMKKKIKNEIGSIFFGGRYIIFLMGLFSIYSGLIYNDVFSKSINMFGSSWLTSRMDNQTVNESTFVILNPATEHAESPYPLGMDPAWQPGKVKKECDEFMFAGQYEMQVTFLFVSLSCVPVLLLGKPLYHHFRGPRRRRRFVEKRQEGSQVFELHSPEFKVDQFDRLQESKSETESFSEIMIHQSIHTIEYILSTVSHTASYLRLWALSLAHSQLSDVLWSKILHEGLTYDSYAGVPILFATFGAWAFLTIAILVMMEGLSAFLHTLRLHWVEFMSKFYKGEGYAFIPFSFKSILDQETEEE